jgi:hypothetical protein
MRDVPSHTSGLSFSLDTMVGPLQGGRTSAMVRLSQIGNEPYSCYPSDVAALALTAPGRAATIDQHSKR